MFFPRVGDSHFGRIHSSLTTVHCFDNGYVGKQPVAWKEYCVEYWLKELQESLDRCTGIRDINWSTVETALNTIQSINFSMRGIVVKYLRRNPRVLCSSRTGYPKFFVGLSLGKTLQSPGLVLVKPRKYLNKVRFRRDMIKLLLKAT